MHVSFAGRPCAVALLGCMLAVGSASAAPPTRAAAPQSPVAGDSTRALIDGALQRNLDADYDRALALVNRKLLASPNDAVLLHYRGFILYRKASILVSGKGDRKLAKELLEDAGRSLERSDATLHWPETRALRSAVLGQLIAFSGRMGAIRLGPRASRLLDEAMAMGPDNPRVWMLRGVSAIFKPRIFGGGLGKAEHDLLRAVSLFANDTPAPPAPWWGYAETFGWLGQVYAKQGRVEEARAAYARALELQPANAWVRDYLVPALDHGAR